jgi:hypothetical protein
VLPDDSTGQGPGTLAAKLSRCKEGMARVFAVMAGANLVIRVSRYNFTKWSSLSPGIGCCKWALARSRYKHSEAVLGAGAKAKTVTNNLPLLSVLWAALYFSIKVGQLSWFISNAFSLHSTFPRSNLLLYRVLPILIDVR